MHAKFNLVTIKSVCSELNNILMLSASVSVANVTVSDKIEPTVRVFIHFSVN